MAGTKRSTRQGKLIMPKRVMVTGCEGQLGYDVVRLLKSKKVECRGVDLGDFSLTDAEGVMQAVQAYRPDAIVHCAAYTAVDKAESEPETCMAVNGMGTTNLVRAAVAVGAKLLYISTDYVFSGEGTEPFETEAPFGPLNVYGLSKLQGEFAVRSLMTNYYILRTSWVFGLHGNNFVKTMLRLGSSRPEVRVVCDQIGSPTYTQDLARVICDMLPTEKYGVYHVRNEGYMSWAQFAEMIMTRANLACRVIPIPTSEYPTPAKRPLNSRLSPAALAEAGFAPMPPVSSALDRYLTELRKSGS